jgi:hypothetical protein
MSIGSGLRLSFCSCSRGEEVEFIEGLFDIHDDGGGTRTEGTDEETLTRGRRQNPNLKLHSPKLTPEKKRGK